MIGYYVVCQLTFWLYVTQIDVKLPYTGNFRCQVIVEEDYTLETGAPGYQFVDCTIDLDWLDTDHPNKFWISKEQCDG